MACIKHILSRLIAFLSLSMLVSSTRQSECHCIDDCLVHEIYAKGEMKNHLFGLCGYNGLPTTLDLNLCFGNKNGKLAWQDKGGGMSSCDCGSRTNHTSIADCSCQNDAGGHTDNSIDLHEGVKYDSNQKVLYCFGNYGTTS